MRPERVEKVRALLDSPQPGERAAAEAALARLKVEKPEKPAPGSPEWTKAMAEHRRKIGFCSVNRGCPALTKDEVTMIRRWDYFGGDPWASGADEVDRLYRKIEQATAEAGQ